MSADILDMLDSKEEPFKEQAQPARAPQQGGSGAKKQNLWEDKDIAPKALNADDLHSVGKTFTIAISKSDTELPPEVGTKIAELTKALFGKGFSFRYNGDQDKFYNPILEENIDATEVYLPWKGFNKSVEGLMPKPELKGYQHAAYYHKAFAKLPDPVRAILARDVHVLLGRECVNPVRFLICYSEDGCETKANIDFKKTGTISFAISVCEDANIPVFNFKNSDAINRLIEYIKTL